MKAHTNDFKNTIKQFGRELDSKITYTLNDEEIELGGEELNSVSVHYEGAILKSVMKQLDIDSNIEIPVGTILTYQFGLKIEDEYEYINYGNYIVYSVEKQEDTNSYKITCYDKLLYAMKEYETPKVNGTPIAYPITIRNYINAICTHLGITFANNSDNFANYNKQIQIELYLDAEGNSLDYTFRDVLDELAQATASTICINNNDELEIKYINNTGDTINEEYLKDINVNFGEMTKPINTIVLSRAGGSDKISISYPEDLPDDEKNAIEIADNQIMNFNDRDTYMTDILNKLNGLSYSLNDFSSTGICYYDLCDRYNVQIGEETYSCIMFNDEINITQGLEELIHTELPEETETDYTKTDKTDRRINQTYIIVDKQNQRIDSVVSSVSEQNNKISQITQTVDEINSKISDIADITISDSTMSASVRLENINASEPVQIRVRPVSDNISYLYPMATSYPSSTTYLKNRLLRFHNETTGVDSDYIIPDDLLIYDTDTYDEFYLDYDSQTCQIIKRCKYNADGTVGVLSSERVVDYTPYPQILLEDGDYTISLPNQNYGYLFVRLMAKNIYTSQFYTKSETNSKINQKAGEIELGVNQTLSRYSTTTEMNSAINIKANEITSSVSETYATKTTTNQLSSRISQTAKNISLTVNNSSTTSGIIIGITKEDGTTEQATGTIEMNGLVKFSNLNDGATTISGSNIKTGTINGNNVNVTNINASNITSGSLSANRISGGTINADNISVTNLSASNINRGTLNSIPYSYNSSSNDAPIMGYRSGSPRWSIASFTAGGRFQTFDSNGYTAAYLNQSGAHTSSDIRYKKHIQNIDRNTSFNIINKLTPIEYDYNTETRHRGLSAQEVEKVLIENGYKNQVYNIEEDGKYTLNYTELIPDLINCIKYLNEKIEKLEREREK